MLRRVNIQVASFLKKHGRQPSTVFIVGSRTRLELLHECYERLAYVRLSGTSVNDISEETAANYLSVKRVVFAARLEGEYNLSDAVFIGTPDGE